MRKSPFDGAEFAPVFKSFLRFPAGAALVPKPQGKALARAEKRAKAGTIAAVFRSPLQAAAALLFMFPFSRDSKDQPETPATKPAAEAHPLDALTGGAFSAS